MSLSDVGSWASIISLVIALIIGFLVYKVKVKIRSSNKENKVFSLIHKGKIKQSNK